MNGGKLSLTKFLDDKATIFASLSKGYKQGGFNTGLGLDGEDIANNLIYDPECLSCAFFLHCCGDVDLSVGTWCYNEPPVMGSALLGPLWISGYNTTSPQKSTV